MANEFYTHSTYPPTNSAGSSAAMRAELDSISQGFDKLPTMAGNGYRLVGVNSGGTGLFSTGLYTDGNGSLGVGVAPGQKVVAYTGGSTPSYFQAANGATGPSASNGTLFGVDAGGNGIISVQGGFVLTFVMSGTERMRLDNSGNLLLGVTSMGTGAVKTIGMSNTTAPTSSPAGMGQLFVEAGALKYRGSSGTVTVVAPA
jgi:hypothetical protein